MREVGQKDYIYGTVPYDHQDKVFKQSRDEIAYALLMEQGTGKTKVGIDTGAWLYINGHIDAIIIVAPNGVHKNWVHIEIPIHMPDYIPHTARVYRAGMGKKEKAKFNELFATGDKGLRIASFNIEAFSKKSGRELPKKFLESFRCLFILDESSRIKNFKAKRTKAIINLAKLSRFRRVLTGTPITQSPLDIFTQFEFLDEEILGFGSYYAFRGHFALLETNYNYKTKKEYTTVTGYQNLAALQKLIAKSSFRVLKRDCLDLPEKIYQKRMVTMSKEQKDIYKALSDNLYAEYQEHEITTQIILTKMLRLQQITGGFVNDDARQTFAIGTTNPKIEELMCITGEFSGKAIIWARFKAELYAIEKALKKEFGENSVVSYHGDVKDADRTIAVDRFQDDPKARWFVGQPRSGGIGLTLTAAEYVIYYSNDFSLETRLQSEDRAHRIGQKKNVTYIDIIAEETVDVIVAESLLAKKNLADIVTGDNLREVIANKT